MMSHRLNRIFHRHQNFVLLLVLFVTFRALTLLAYRPGGQVLDFSDFYFYREFAQLDRQGYIPYSTIWTTYPPLFPLLMRGVWHASALLPPWEFSNLWLTLLLGGVFLVFETGNFILLYLIALRLYPPEQAFKPAWIYAALFTPVYTMTGWFESYPLFFFLLSLYLLVRGRPYLSALFGGVGFMVKLMPVILLPVGAKLLPRTSTRGRLKIDALNVDVDLKWLALYLLVFAVTVAAIGYPFFRMNPRLMTGPFRLTAARPAWETVWALLEGNYTYGVIPFDMRDLTLASAGAPGSPLPWGLITLAFGLLYAFLYTRRVHWHSPVTLLAFTGLTVCLFFLYSKGYSPQWLGWILVFSSLLLPNLRGVLYAALLSVANIIEANLFFIIFPQEHWLLAATVLLRTGLVVVLAFEFSLLVWPHLRTPALLAARSRILKLALVALALALIPAALRLRTAYFEQRLVQSPYQSVIQWLREQPVTEAMLLNSHTTYDWFYPYLRHSHAFFMLDDYAGGGTTVKAKTTRLLNTIAANYRAVWVFDSDPAHTTPAETAARQWLAAYPVAHQADIDGGRLYLYILQK